MLPRYALRGFFFCVLLQPHCFWSQSAPFTKKPPQSKPSRTCRVPGVKDAADASYTLQPPLAADALIRIARKVSEPCPALAKDLLHHAFDLAGGVDPRIALTIGSGLGVSTDSRLFQAHSAYLLQEDSLSLRSRAVLAAVAFDSRLAIDLFQRITPPSPAASGCNNALVPEVAIYYESAEKVLPLLKKSISNQEPTAQAELQELVSTTTSATQLIPLAHLLVSASANLSQSEFASLLNATAVAIDNLPLDDNAFHSRGQYPAIKAYDQLVPIAKAKQVSSSVLAQAVHNYLERSLNGPHCDGNVPKDLKELVILYKSLDRSTATSDVAQPLSAPTVAPPVEPAPDTGEYWLGPKTKQLLVDCKHLNFDDNWNRYTEADRKTPEWRDRVQRLLDDVEDWHQSDEADPRRLSSRALHPAA